MSSLCESTCSKADRGYRCCRRDCLVLPLQPRGAMMSPYSMPQARSVDNSIWPNRSQAKKSSMRRSVIINGSWSLLGVKTKLRPPYLNRPSSETISMRLLSATGVHPRNVTFDGAKHPKVLSYIDVLRDKKPVGDRVVVIGAGGIGFDVCEFLAHEHDDAHPAPSTNVGAYLSYWGIDPDNEARGGITNVEPKRPAPARQLPCCNAQRKVGARLVKPRGWIHRTT